MANTEKRRRWQTVSLCVLAAGIMLAEAAGLNYYRRTWHEYSDNAAWEAHLASAGALGGRRLVLFGDSEVAYWPMAESFGSLAIINRGVPGDMAMKARERVGRDIIANSPTTVVILIGTNDLGEGRAAKDIIEDVEQIVSNAQANSINVILCSLLPASKRYLANHRPRDLVSINRQFRELASRRRTEYVDLYSFLTDANGEFSAALTVDGLHPNRAGYGLMTQHLLPFLLGSLAAGDVSFVPPSH